jgi:hypothetical protein
MNLEEIRCESLDRIQMDQDRVQSRSLVNVKMKLKVP